jgi:hypothetical protein
MLSITFSNRMILLLTAAVMAGGCTAQAPPTQQGSTQYASSPGYNSSFGTPVGVPAGSSISLAQAQIIKAQQDHADKTWITVLAPVYKNLPDDTEPPTHQRFLLKLDNGSTVLVAHNTELARRVPIFPGNVVSIHGEYIWNEKGGVLHWTHHDPRGTIRGGYIELNGQQYK